MVSERGIRKDCSSLSIVSLRHRCAQITFGSDPSNGGAGPPLNGGDQARSVARKDRVHCAPIISNVSDEREHRQEQDPADGVSSRLADGELDQGRARATELVSTAPMT